ncbi:MAG: hypothetical protein ACT4N2_00940 [Hyphomicrobium sp.]
MFGPPAADVLRLASLDLRLLTGVAAQETSAAETAGTRRPSWRTSFGSEFRPRQPRFRAAASVEADVVLIQGVSSVREARRLFPPRFWKLVVSRQLLASDDPLDPWSRDATSANPTTAVAVRYQQGLRVTGQDHLLKLAAPEGTDASLLTGARPAGTAVRLNMLGRTLWVVSAELPPGCRRADVAACPERSALESWRQARRENGEATYAGGRIEEESADAPCPGQSILDDVTPASSPTNNFISRPVGERNATVGCLLRLDVPR